MLHEKKILVIAFVFLFGTPSISLAQSTKNVVEKLYNSTEQLYSTDDLLVNGQAYVYSRKGIKGDPFFKENKFVEGFLDVRGRTFEGEYLKYDLENQRVILRTALQSGKFVTILLNPDMIDSFSIYGRKFINASHFFSQKDLNGFYIQVYHKSFSFLIQYEKMFREIYNQRSPNGRYSELQTHYFLLKGDKIENVTKKSALLNNFPTHNKEIKNFMRRNKIKYRKADRKSLHKLMKYCDSISAE